LTEKFVADKEALIEALDSKATEYLTKHLAEFADSVAKFRDLDAELAQTKLDLQAEFAEKLVEAKKQTADGVKADMAVLVDRLDEFLEIRLTEEVKELNESIELMKKLNFGHKLFEAFSSEFATKFANTDETAIALDKATAELADKAKVLESVNAELAAVKREQEMAKVLESLQGRPREVMAAILNKVPTDKLVEQYNVFIGRVLHESVVSKVEESTESEKENGNPSVLAEGKDNSAQEEKVATKVATGNTPVVEQKEAPVEEPKKLTESEVSRLKRLSGIS